MVWSKEKISHGTLIVNTFNYFYGVASLINAVLDVLEAPIYSDKKRVFSVIRELWYNAKILML